MSRSKYEHILTKEFLEEEYINKKRSSYNIAKEIGCGKSTILLYLKKYDIEKRPSNYFGLQVKYLVNQKYFDTWSPEMAYVLGFTITDGFVSKNKGNLYLGYGCATKDIKILEFIRNQLSPTRPIGSYIYFDEQYKKDRCGSCLSIYSLSNNLINKLLQLGICERKTGKEFLPTCPEKHKGDLLRGIFDGDGWLEYNSRGTKNGTSWMYGICSASHKFLDQVQKKLCFGYGNITPNNGIWRLRICSRGNISHVASVMYKNNYFSLDRKKKLFLDNNFLKSV